VKEVVYLDFTDDTVPYHKSNLIKLPLWEGDSNDRELYDIIPFLESKSAFYLSYRFGTKARWRCER